MIDAEVVKYLNGDEIGLMDHPEERVRFAVRTLASWRRAAMEGRQGIATWLRGDSESVQAIERAVSGRDEVGDPLGGTEITMLVAQAIERGDYMLNDKEGP